MRLLLGIQNNPTYPCIYTGLPSHASLFSPHPFPLAGVQEDRGEQVVILLNRILKKIMVTEHPVFLAHPNTIMELASLLLTERISTWVKRKVIPKGHFRRFKVSQLSKLVTALDNIKEAKDKSKFQLWDIFVFIFGGLTIHPSMENHFKDFHASIPEITSNILANFEDSLMIYYQVVNVLQSHLIPYQEVVRIVCGGQLEQNCSNCLRTA